MIVDRKKAPGFHTLEGINLIKAVEYSLSNNAELYILNGGSQDILKIELLFSAGSLFQEGPLIASTVNKIISEGTAKHSSSEIAGIIDYYGAFLQTDADKDFATVTLYVLNKHLKNVLPVFKEIITDAIFPEEELTTFIQNEKQKFLVENEKVNRIAGKHFNELLFGPSSPYGYNVKLEDYDKLDRKKLIDFHHKHYKANNCKIIVSGKADTTAIDLIVTYFGNDWASGEDILSKKPVQVTTKNRTNIVVKQDAVQSAIRIGRTMFNKTHPDYMGMQVLNTVLGGYFGSRLMSNIREEKGYTYGIGSGIVSMQHGGYFFISTEVGVDVCQKAIDEIYLELRRLREDLIPENELQLVRNYLMGVFLRSVDGPFALADRFKSIIEYNLGYEFYENYIHTVKNISSGTLRELASKYFKEEEMIELVVGKK